eukprot:COSAG02_NODE_3910_length_6056_cov_3.352694_10_plen_126_part_00
MWIQCRIRHTYSNITADFMGAVRAARGISFSQFVKSMQGLCCGDWSLSGFLSLCFVDDLHRTAICAVFLCTFATPFDSISTHLSFEVTVRSRKLAGLPVFSGNNQSAGEIVPAARRRRLDCLFQV